MRASLSRFILTAILFTLFVGLVSAQDELPTIEPSTSENDACPLIVEEAFIATGLQCEELGVNQICYGFGIIETETPEGVELTFANGGDIISISDVNSINLRSTRTEANAWAVAWLTPAMPSTSGDPIETTVVAFGDLTLTENTTQPTSVQSSIGTVRAGGGLNVRREPGASGTLVWQLTPNEQVVAIGLSEDEQWVRIIIPNEFQGVGWVYAPYLDVEGGAERLPRATQTSPVPEIQRSVATGALQEFTLRTRLTDDACNDTPDSGLLMQSPSGVVRSTEFIVNGITVRFSGTIFLQAIPNGGLTMNVMEGDGSISANDSSQDIAAGQQSTVPIDATLLPIGTPTAPLAITSSNIRFLPIDLLPRQFNLDSVIQAEPQEQSIPEDATAPEEQAAPEISSDECVLSSGSESLNLRTGPGTEFDLAGVLSANTSVIATGRGSDANNFIWYQLETGDWIRSDTIEISGEACENLPPGQLPTDIG